MKKRLWIGILLAAVVCLWGFYENTRLQLNSFPVNVAGLPDPFDGFRIAHISDLHNARFGENNEELIKLLNQAKPDLIAITGDLVDSRKTDIGIALAFAREAVKIAPCCYVPGNHEARIPEYARLETGLQEAGVMVLRNEALLLERDGEQITVAGAADPAFGNADFAGTLESLASGEVTVLLSHRPELFEEYCRCGFSLVLSGHAHGGQFRLPVLGGLVAPGQGFFPRYDSGYYTEGNTAMVVSRGLGNSLFPFRLNNPPETLLITLTK